MDNFCGATRAPPTFDGMTRIEVSPEEVVALASSLAEVALTLGDLDVMGPEAGWLPAGPVSGAFREVVTTWQRQRLRLERSLGDLADAAALAGRHYLETEDESTVALRPGRSGPQ